jgi:hypothetical protein
MDCRGYDQLPFTRSMKGTTYAILRIAMPVGGTDTLGGYGKSRAMEREKTIHALSVCFDADFVSSPDGFVHCDRHAGWRS